MRRHFLIKDIETGQYLNITDTNINIFEANFVFSGKHWSNGYRFLTHYQAKNTLYYWLQSEKAMFGAYVIEEIFLK